MIEKKNRIVPDNAENSLPVVPSISDLNPDELTSPQPDSPGNFDIPDDLSGVDSAEPEAILDIPSFSGLDTLDVATALTQTIRNLTEDSLDSFRKLPEVPDYAGESSGQTAQIPSFLDLDENFNENFNAQPGIPDFDTLTSSGTETLPEIPSFLEQEHEQEQENFNLDLETENLPDISDFLEFPRNPEEYHETPEISEIPVIPEKPEKPENFSMQENLQEILPGIPSVSDDPALSELSGMEFFRAEVPENFVNPENPENPEISESTFLPEIPSVSDEEWEKEIEESWEQDAGMQNNPESSEALFAEFLEISGDPGHTENPEDPGNSVPIAELPLSLTALHYLQKIEIHDSLELLEASQEALEAIPEIDAKTLREILHVRQLQKQNQAEAPEQQPVSEEFETLLDLFLHDLEQIGVSEKRQIRLKAYLRAVKPEKAEKKACFSAWYQETHVQLQLDKYMTGLLRKRQMSGLSVEMLAESLPSSLDREILTGMLREMLSADRLIESRDGFYTLKYPPVLKFLADNTDRKQQHIQVLQQRMDGMTPEEIAQDAGISKEHVLEIQNRTLRLVQKLCLINRTSVYEERFRPLYESYDLSQEIFEILTKESGQVYRYLGLVAFPGNKQPDEVFTDLGVPGWVRENWKEYRANYI